MDSDKARSQYDNYRYCYDNGHKDWIAKASMCFSMWEGNQWAKKDRAKLEREGRPALTLNVIESLVRAMQGVQRALRSDVRFVPYGSSSANDAYIRDLLWMHTQNLNEFNFLESDVWLKGIIMGRAYYDVRMNFDDNIEGDVEITSPRSQDIILDPSVSTYNTTRWPQVFDQSWESLSDIEYKYGKDVADELRGRGTHPDFYDYEDAFMAHQMGKLPHFVGDMRGDDDKMRGLLVLGRQYYTLKRKKMFIDVDTGDMSEVPENWDRNKISAVLEKVPNVTVIDRSVRTVRWTVTCEDVVLKDVDSPFNRFTIVPFFPTFLDGVSMGVVQHLVDPQMLYNKMTSSELHIISTTANSGYKLKSGSLVNMSVQELEERGSKTGFVAELRDVNDLEKITPNSTPQGHDRLSFKADQIMRQLAGSSNSSRGFAREDVSGDAITENRAAQEVNFASMLDNLHRSKAMVATSVIDCARSYYSGSRVLRVNKGSALVPNEESVTINQIQGDEIINDITVGKYTTTLIPAPSRTTMGEADFRMLLELRKDIGIMIPDEMLIELSPAANKLQIIQMLKGNSIEEQQRAAKAAEEERAVNLELASAKAAKERTASALNQSRAEKFSVEAQTDPDSSYERVETARIEAEQRERDRRFALDREIAQNTAAHNEQKLAVQLATASAKAEQKPAAKGVAKKPVA